MADYAEWKTFHPRNAATPPPRAAAVAVRDFEPSADEEPEVRFRRGQYVTGRHRSVRTVTAEDGPIHQHVPRCLVVQVIEHPSGVYYRVRGWWVVPFDYLVPGDQLRLHTNQAKRVEACW
ncbi:hypothetical protein [Embleya sp. AB8]|uniref:hypothetical protein n=1 Tax=Embleya sp. AB8 TaxID=3156304 RepID=UPI003C7519A4